MEQKQRWKRQNQTTNDKIVMSDDDSDEKRSWRTMPISIWHVELSFSYTFATLTFYKKKSKSQCANAEQKQRWERWNRTTSDKIIMSDDDSDEKLSRRTMPMSMCTCGTLILVPHSHIDLFTNNMQQSTCECGAETKMETIEWDDKRQNCHVRQRQRWTKYHDRRCQWAFVYVELSF